ncbi:hypothetical protein BC833DRAFT_593545 [Globomyces pollinis-pini]|nr:hypothetical protein BC833DRAFT_593545 [Globomyces pollinis-pini]
MARRQASRPAPRQAPARPAAQPQTPAPVQAAPPAPVPAAAPQGPGMMASIAANAASIAIGHTVAQGVSGMLFGNSSQPAPQQAAPVQQAQAPACEPDQKAFMKCLETNSNDINACQFYLDMLKQCQSTTRTTFA